MRLMLPDEWVVGVGGVSGRDEGGEGMVRWRLSV